jgi:hypothetical protein
VSCFENASRDLRFCDRVWADWEPGQRYVVRPTPEDSLNPSATPCFVREVDCERGAVQSLQASLLTMGRHQQASPSWLAICQDSRLTESS